MDYRKSTCGYMMTFVGGAMSWQSKLQQCVALVDAEIPIRFVIVKVQSILV